MAQRPRSPESPFPELLRTKLMPPRRRAGRVPRSALLERLDEGLAYKLTLLSAPAGFGKTTLVSEWLACRSEHANLPPVAWVSLDKGDNDPVRFWRYVIAACQTFDASVGTAALALLGATPRPAFETILTSLINDLTRLSRHSILILEDYHAVDTQQVHEGVSFLLDHLPITLHLIMISRSDPPLPLARLRARNESYELRAADLRFSQLETVAFLQENVSFPLPPAAVALLEERTEGWVAGLQLVTLALQQRQQSQATEHLLATFSGTHHHILEYLVTEVLAAQPGPLQEFLLQTTFLNRLAASLCDAITGRNDSVVILERLDRANLFLSTLDGAQQAPTSSAGGSGSGETWYRYHPLFAEAMHQVARRRLGEASLRGLYNKASLWYEQHGYLGDAVETALSAQAYARAATLIERITEVGHFHSELHTLRRWVEQLPEEILRAHPRLCLSHALAILFTSDRSAPATAGRLQKPLQMAEERWLAEENEPQLGQLFAFRSLVAFWQGDLPASFAAAREALALLPVEDAYWRGISTLNVAGQAMLAGKLNEAQQILLEARTLCAAAGNSYGTRAATYLLGEVCIEQAELNQAAQLFQQVLEEATEDPLDQGHALVGLGLLAYEWNNLDVAERRALQAIEIGHNHTDTLGPQHAGEALAVPASLILAQVAQARGEPTQARQRLEALLAETQLSPLRRREVETCAARFALTVSDIAAVERWRAANAQRADDIFRLHQEREALVVARLAMAQGEAEEALRLLDHWRADAHTHGRTGREVEILALSALAHFALGNLSHAKETLIHSLTLAQPGHYQRLFLDEGEAMAALLQAVYPDVREQSLALYVRRLLLAFAEESTEPVAAPAAGSSGLIEPLSAQEERVLRLLAAGRANPEIAQELVVSVNTVKTQVQSIYRKLDVHSREEAGDVARHLGLI
ncbi:MAG: transcriptional regulator [Chloroflexi bacterium]|nr:MAG: transcriptional regulator [Chloroflexota bacterium]